MMLDNDEDDDYEDLLNHSKKLVLKKLNYILVISIIML